MIDNYYAAINLRSIKYALRDLTPAQFEVWLYFAKNREGYEFWVSPVAAYNEFGISVSTFRKAKRILKERGYLVKNDDGYWDFYEIPKIDFEIEKVRKMSVEGV
jgi:hypothetical protein